MNVFMLKYLFYLEYWDESWNSESGHSFTSYYLRLDIYHTNAESQSYELINVVP